MSVFLASRRLAASCLVLATVLVALFASVQAQSGPELHQLTSTAQCFRPYGLTKDTTSGVVYAACADPNELGSTGNIVAINGNTVTTIANYTSCANPHGIARNTMTGVVYAACENYGPSGGIIAISGSMVTRVATAQQCAYAWDVAVNSITGVVYAACADTGIIAINGASITTVVNMTACRATGLSLDAARNVVYASCWYTGPIMVEPLVAGYTITSLANVTRCGGNNGVFADPTTGVVYASCQGSGQDGGIIAIAGSTVTKLATVQQCTAYGVTKDLTNGVVYAVCSEGVIAIDGPSVTIVANGAQCSGAFRVLADSLSGVVYAACSNGAVISLGTPRVLPSGIKELAPRDQCQIPYSLYKDPTSNMVYAACGGNFGAVGILAIDSATGMMSYIVNGTQCGNPQSMTKNTNTGVVYAACFDSGIIAINGKSITTIATPAQCYQARGVFFDNSTGLVYAACQGGNVVKITATNVTQLTTGAQCVEPVRVLRDPNSGVVYAACTQTGVVAIAGSSVTTIADLSQCGYPNSIYKDFATGVVYATCQSGGAEGGVIAIVGSRVTRIAASSQCYQARGVSKNTRTGVVYATCNVGQTVIAIRGTEVTTVVPGGECAYPADVFVDSVSGAVYPACSMGPVMSVGAPVVAPPSITGDPQFVGFLGQSYQVHGIPGSIYDVISSAAVQVNAEFRFLPAATCNKQIKARTECWTHPGTYLGSIGISIRLPANNATKKTEETVRVLIESGAAEHGLRVHVNDFEVHVSDSHLLDLVNGVPTTRAQWERSVHAARADQADAQMTAAASAPLLVDDGFIETDAKIEAEVKARYEVARSSRSWQRARRARKARRSLFAVDHPNAQEVTVWVGDFSLRFINSDNFVNQQVSLLNLEHVVRDVTDERQTAAPVRVHGVLGQTVRNHRYDNRWSYIEGDINDYMTSGLFQTDDLFSKFNL
jgi:riboflavin synthase alpha subunit